jgi:putative acetyltransferase
MGLTSVQMDQIQVRPERAGDEPAIAQLDDEAFGHPSESRVVDAVRRGGHATISLVAVDGTRVVGHILFTRVAIESAGPAIDALGLGPMAVLPELQRRGIGSRLVEAGLRDCARVGCQVVVVVGHPAFYPRFGFRPARSFGLRSEYDVPDEVFMAIELTEGALTGGGGLVRYLPAFGSA